MVCLRLEGNLVGFISVIFLSIALAVVTFCHDSYALLDLATMTVADCRIPPSPDRGPHGGERAPYGNERLYIGVKGPHGS